MADGWQIGGLNKLVVDLGHAPAVVTAKTEILVRKTAADVERTSKILAPVDTGNLRSTISTDVDGLNAEIGPTAEYGVYVEDGTSTQEAQPYMGPAFDRHAPVFETAMGILAARALG